MPNKKNILSEWLLRTGILRLMAGRGRRFIVLNYHRVWSDVHKKMTLFDDEVFGPTVSELDQQFGWLKQNTDVISEDDLCGITRGEFKPPRRGVMITFDDGYVDNYTLAWPLLRKHGLPAIFFIPTKAIEERTVGWWDYVAYLLKKTRHETIVFEGRNIRPGSDIQEAIHYVLSFIDYNRKDTGELLSELCKACDVELPDAEIQDKELMTWDNLREMSHDGMSIGSHTHSHRILSSLDIPKQRKELLESKHVLEEKLDVHVRSMSYPVGDYHHFTGETCQEAERAGYELAFSFLTGINSWETITPMDIKRISVSSYFPRFVGTMCMPRVFCDCA